jgi:hypothetical protein
MRNMPGLVIILALLASAPLAADVEIEFDAFEEKWTCTSKVDIVPYPQEGMRAGTMTLTLVHTRSHGYAPPVMLFSLVFRERHSIEGDANLIAGDRRAMMEFVGHHRQRDYVARTFAEYVSYRVNPALLEAVAETSEMRIRLNGRHGIVILEDAPHVVAAVQSFVEGCLNADWVQR